MKLYTFKMDILYERVHSEKNWQISLDGKNAMSWLRDVCGEWKDAESNSISKDYSFVELGEHYY